MNMQDMEGRKAKQVYYGKDGECLQEAKNGDNYIKEIILATTFHGEYDLVWLCVYENGKEIMRINAKMVESIIWEA